MAAEDAKGRLALDDSIYVISLPQTKCCQDQGMAMFNACYFDLML